MLGCYANQMFSEYTRENMHKPPVSPNNHKSKVYLIFTNLKLAEINLIVYNSTYVLQLFSREVNFFKQTQRKENRFSPCELKLNNSVWWRPLGASIHTPTYNIWPLLLLDYIQAESCRLGKHMLQCFISNQVKCHKYKWTKHSRQVL